MTIFTGIQQKTYYGMHFRKHNELHFFQNERKEKLVILPYFSGPSITSAVYSKIMKIVYSSGKVY